MEQPTGSSQPVVERDARRRALERLRRLPRQAEDVADLGPPDDPSLPGKTSDTLKRQEIPPDA